MGDYSTNVAMVLMREKAKEGTKHTKENVLDVIKLLCTRLKDKKGWFIGGSASLLVYGIDIIPNDIDLGVDIDLVNEVKEVFSDYEITRNEKDLDQFIVNNILVELCVFPVDISKLNTVEIDGVAVYVNPLRDEYEFYKQREDKKEANKKKIRMIEELLSKNM